MHDGRAVLFAVAKLLNIIVTCANRPSKHDYYTRTMQRCEQDEY